MNKLDSKLDSQLDKLVAVMGYEWLGCELVPQGGQLLLRIYIDSPKGVSVDDCSKVNHQVGALLDVEDPFHCRYILEVSSPGIDRPLFTIKHYQKALGKRIKLRLSAAINQRKQYKGLLKEVKDDHILLLMEEDHQEVKLPLAIIDKANLIGEILLNKQKLNDRKGKFKNDSKL